jgi:hypothetical protein
LVVVVLAVVLLLEEVVVVLAQFVTEPHLYLDHRQQQFKSELVDSIINQDQDHLVMELHHSLVHQ